MKLNEQQRDFIHLIMRSKDVGDGWRQVSNIMWPTTQRMESTFSELVEINEDLKQIRLSDKGKTIFEWLV